MKYKLIVTRRWPEHVEQSLAERFDCEFNATDEPFTLEQYRDALQRADGLLATVTDQLDQRAFAIKAPKTRIIANFGVGYSHIDLASATAHSITVTNTPDVLSDCTADIAMTLMLIVARRAGEGERELPAGKWSGWRPTHMVGSKVSGKSLGIVGFGRIGQAMARRAHHGFGMRVNVYNRSVVAPEVLAAAGATQLQSLEQLLAQSDFVSLHCPGGDQNRHLIDANALASMQSGAYLINTARGEVVDDEALIDALQSHRIAGAGLDVFNGEPDLDQRYLSLDNAVLLPHLGSATLETREGMGLRVLANLDQFFAGETPQDLVV